MKTKTKLLSLVFIVAFMLILAMSITADDRIIVEGWNISATENDNVTANIYNDPNNEGMYILEIVGKGEMKGWSYKQQPWYASYGENLISAKLSEGITNLGHGVFWACSNITSVEIPSTVTSIGQYAFSYCSNLNNLNLPNGVTKIGICAFNMCNNLKDINIPESVSYIPDETFYGCSSLENIVIPNSVFNIGWSAFYGCYNLKSVTFNDGISVIGNLAFSNTGIVNLEIPNNITSIGTQAFYNCSKLTSVVLPNNLNNFGSDVFSNCRSLTNVVVPYGVGSISNFTFRGCTNLKTIELPNSITYIGQLAFEGCYSLTSIVIPSSVTTMYNNAFGGCTNLKLVTIDSPTIASQLSSNTDCGNLVYYADTVVIKTDIDEIGSYITDFANYPNRDVVSVLGAEYNVFSKHSHASDSTEWSEVDENNIVTCSKCGLQKKVETRTLVETWDISATANDNVIANLYEDPDNEGMYTLEIVGTGNMKYWSRNRGTNIISIIIAEGVTNIDNNAFRDYTSLTNVEIPNSVITIGSAAFYNCTSLTSIEIPNSVINIGSWAFGKCTSLEEVHFNATAMDDLSYGDCVFNQAGQNGNGIKVTIGKNVTKIPAGLFYLSNHDLDSTKIITVEFEENSICESIGDNAFGDCISLTNVEIPNSVTSIGNDAFSRCTSLTNVEIPNSVTSIGNYAFYNCTSLTSIEIPNSVTCIGNYAFSNCTSLTSIEIPNSETSIGNHAFSYCTSLTSIEIPNSVTSLGNFAFSNCTSLEEIYFNANAMNDLSSNNWVFSNAGQSGNGIKVIIGKNVTKIPANLFGSNNSLKIISTEFEEGSICETIGNYAFSYCTSLTSIEIPNSVTSLGNYAFSNCTSLEEIYFNANAMNDLSLNNCVFSHAGQNGNGIKVIIGKNVTKVPSNLFYSSSSGSKAAPKIISVKFEEGSTCETIGNSAFYDCITLTSIEIPNSITTIGSNAFYNCYKLVEIYNLSALKITKGSSVNGYLGYYALNIYTPDEGEKKTFETEDGFIFYEDGEICYLVGYKGDEKDIVLPANCSGKKYEIYNYAFYTCTSLTSIEIPNSITTIGKVAFENCTSLTSIKIPNSVTSIGNNAFYNCTSLTSVKIPNSVTSIGHSVFDNCTSLTSIEIPNSVISIGNRAFNGCRSLTSIEIPSSVTSIGNEAFSYCTSLTSVKIPNSVTNIGNSTFGNCTSLTSIEIPNSVITIGNRAFYNCTSLTSVELPNSVTKIAQYAFYNCTKLFEIENGVYYVNKWVIDYDTNITSVCLRSNTVGIADFAFSSCKTLTSIEMSNSVKSIGDYAFYNCTSLTSVVIGNSVTSIGNHAFRDCTSLTSIEIPNSVTNIGNSAFYNCTSLTSIVIGNSVTTLADAVFRNCTSLEKIYFNATAMNDLLNFNEIFYNAGQNGNGIRVMIGKNVTKIPTALFYSNSKYLPKIISVEFEEGSACESIGNSAFYSCASLESIEISNSVTGIGDSAFYNCTSLTSIVIGNSVTNIGNSAFYNCTSLTSVVIGNSVTSIGNHAFRDCTSLEKIYFNANAMNDLRGENKVFYQAGQNGNGIKVVIGKNVTKIPSYLFHPDPYSSNYSPKIISVEFEEGSVCESIGNSAFYSCTSLESIEIPNSITNIGEKAFRNCQNLNKIIIPNSVINIYSQAFMDCYELKFVVIDSPIIASKLTSRTSCGNLINYANTVLVNSSIKEIGSYLTDTANYPYIETVSVYGTEYKVFSKHAHPGDIFELSVIEPTCSEYGYNVYTCTSCGMVKTETLEKLPHTEETIPAVLPTPTKAGYTLGVKCTLCGEYTVEPKQINVTELTDIKDPNFRVASASLDLAESICVFYKAIVTEGYNNPYMVFIYEGIEYVITDYTIEQGTGRYVFRFDKVLAYKMAKNIEAYVYAETAEGEYSMNKILEYSVMQYCINQFKKDIDDEFRTVLSDVLALGAANQIYEGFETNALVTDLVSAQGYVLTPSVYTGISADKNVQSLTGDRTQGVDWKSANLLVGSNIKVQLKFEANSIENLTVRVNVAGSDKYFTSEDFTKDGNRYVVDVDYLTSMQYDKTITATFYQGETQVGSTLTYSVNSYLVRNAENTAHSETMRSLLQTIYTYGETMKAYFTKN